LAYYVDTAFTVTNPNCEGSITITYFAILDEDGNVVIEGTPQQLNNVPDELGPHEIWQFDLVYFVGSPPMSDETPTYWTVEITFNSTGDRPLIGWFQPHFHTFTFFGKIKPNQPWEKQVDDVDVTSGGCQMMNFAD